MEDVDAIDPLAPEPMYRQLAAIIRARIESGELQPRRPIPSEKDLQQTYGVGRDTARAAIAYLREEGWVFTVPQRGTYVAERG